MKTSNKLLTILTAFTGIIGLCIATLVCFIFIYTRIHGEFSSVNTRSTSENASIAQIDTVIINTSAETDVVSADNYHNDNISISDLETAETASTTEPSEIIIIDTPSNEIPIVAPAENSSPVINESVQSSSIDIGSGNGDNSYFNTYDNTEQQHTEDTYVLNTSTMKIHYPSCSSIVKIAPQNYSTTNLSVDELKSQGYSTCGICF